MHEVSRVSNGFMNRAILALAFTVAICGGDAPAASCLDFGAGIATTYDDNILAYSERDLFAFQYRLNPPRFSLETTDDVILSPYVEVAWEPDSTRSTSVVARFEANRYATNTIRNNVESSLQWRTWPGRRWRVTVSGNFLPSYYMRRYIDDDVAVPYPQLPRYRDGKYRQTGAAANVEWRPGGSWRGQLGYDYHRRDFLRAFPERDQNRHAVKLSVRPPRYRQFEARLRAEYGRAVARARDGDEAGGPPDDPDISTRTLAAGLTLEWTPRRRDPSITLRQVLDYEDRRYTTNDILDTQRFGRSIHETDLEWELAYEFSSHWQATGSYGIDLQRLTGPLTNLDTFTDAGSYNRHQVSVSLGWTSRRRRSE